MHPGPVIFHINKGVVDMREPVYIDRICIDQSPEAGDVSDDDRFFGFVNEREKKECSRNKKSKQVKFIFHDDREEKFKGNLKAGPLFKKIFFRLFFAHSI